MKQLTENQVSDRILLPLQLQTGLQQFTRLVTGLSSSLDKLAGFFMVALMGLVITNVLLRTLLNRPILGTYEFVGYLMSAVIALALANCAVQKGHIAVTCLVEKFPAKMQGLVDMIMNFVALLFWSFAAWQMGKYANSLALNNVVSPTTKIPYYPFIYLVALSLVAVCLVLFTQLLDSVKKVAHK
ncbi:MAG: TRAP transporter small permease [Bacillota bacterium]|nr:TRAP transporter small permease [Bacillota bacterium]